MRCIMAYPCKTERELTVACLIMSVITHSSYGNTLHYGLSMFIEFEKVSYVNPSFSHIEQVTTQYQTHCKYLTIFLSYF